MARSAIVAERVGRSTQLTRARAETPMRFTMPSFPGCDAKAVCLVPLGGGLVDGDAYHLDVTVGEGASLLLFTSQTTKVFAGTSTQTLGAKVRGTLFLLPDPVACFQAARYSQRVEVELEGDGACVLLDGYTAGRPGYGETWAMDRIEARTTISHDGTPVLRDALVLDRDDGDLRARMRGAETFMTLIAFGDRVARFTERLAEVAPSAEGDTILTVSPLPTSPASPHVQRRGVVVRIAGQQRERVSEAISARLRNLSEIGGVDPFASRS